MVSKKDGKKMAAKEHGTSKMGSISSPNVFVPSRHSEFFDEYKDKLEADYHLLKEPLSTGNYKEKFHHLLCWEENEHNKQLAERLSVVSVIDVCLTFYHL